MQLLNEKLIYYSQKYFQENISEISDFEYDVLFNELKNLEQKNPESITYDSIIKKIGFQSSKIFPSFAHPIPMNSLDKALDQNEFISFIHDREKILKEKIKDFFVSLKLDGLALELIYQNNQLLVGATRGNGIEGENITENVKQIESIPHRIAGFNKDASEKIIIIRGEIIFSKEEFHKINKRLQDNHATPFVNPRNAVSGTMRQLNSNIVAERKILFFAYEFTNFKDFIQYDSQLVNLDAQFDYLKKWGFKVNEYNQFIHSKNLKPIFEYYKWVEGERKKIDYEIDGVVIKLNKLNFQEKLGIAGNKPRYSIAWKFSPEIKISKLLDVEFQVGRTGKITPVGILEPINISGATVQRVTLHNENEILLKDIKIQDWLKITRSGDVIPKVLEVVKEKRNQQVKNIVFPTHCPSCHNLLVKKDQNKLLFCLNENCSIKQYKNIINFVTKEGVNIEGVGKKVIKELIKQGKIKNIVDIYKLESKDFDSFPRMGEKLKKKYLEAIKKSKKINLNKFIYSLSIRGVGKKVATILANKFQRVGNLFFIKKEELLEIDEIGEVLSDELVSFFNKSQNVKLIEEILKLKVTIDFKKKKKGKLADKKILFSGTLSRPRNIIKGEAEAEGAEILSGINKKLDFLVVGKNSGSKKKKAEQLGITVLNEDSFLKLLS